MTSTGDLPPRNRATSSCGRTVAESPMRCAGFSSNASRRSRLEREVRSSFVVRDRVDLVDDDRVDVLECLARLRREQQEE